MTEIELKNQVQRAQRAEQLLNDPMIQGFIVAVRGELLTNFESSALSEEAERMAAWNQSQVFNRFVDKFTKEIKDGKNAQFTLSEKAKPKVKRII